MLSRCYILSLTHTFCHPLHPVIGVVLISSCGHAQVLGDNLQFQPINDQQYLANTSTISSLEQASSQGISNVAPVSTQTHPIALDGQRFQEIVVGSERFALELFSVSVDVFYCNILYTTYILSREPLKPWNQ